MLDINRREGKAGKIERSESRPTAPQRREKTREKPPFSLEETRDLRVGGALEQNPAAGPTQSLSAQISVILDQRGDYSLKEVTPTTRGFMKPQETDSRETRKQQGPEAVPPPPFAVLGSADATNAASAAETIPSSSACSAGVTHFQVATGFQPLSFH